MCAFLVAVLSELFFMSMECFFMLMDCAFSLEQTWTVPCPCNRHARLSAVTEPRQKLRGLAYS